MPICEISGEPFEISEFEKKQRQKLGAPPATKLPQYVFRELGAFWPHFSIHKRQSDFSGKEIVSVWDTHCPYPVWHRDEWFKNANHPSADFNFQRPFFEQLWELFQKCPIPHNNGLQNENCEYTDDWWHSKNCYLCHSGFNCEDLQQCFRTLHCRDSQFLVFTFDSELSSDLIHCFNCYNVHFALHSRNCRDSAFLFDCRNCSDCLFCWNLRNKRYCIANQQLSKEDFEEEKQKFSLASRQNFALSKKRFLETIFQKAWWRVNQNEKCENVSGDYLQNDKNCTNCFFASENEDCVNNLRSGWAKDCVDCINVALQAEMCHTTCGGCDKVFGLQFCQNVSQSRFLEYCAFCEQCENCFACSGLVGKKYHILNKPYAKNEYEKLVAKIKSKIQIDGEAGKFFPPYFAACPYEESWSGIYFPLSIETQKKYNFRLKIQTEIKKANYASPLEIPDKASEATEDICQKKFWDAAAKRPFQITKANLEFAQKNQIPLPAEFYLKRLKENFKLMFFNGILRKTHCAATGEKILTALPEFLDGRILSEKAYQEKIY